ncbi:HAD-IIIA family hydrolase [Planktomarina temperata]|nr:HAD-IIIA family hydrolase [Planktomarina temperata]
MKTNAAIFLDRDGVINEAIVKQGLPFPPQNMSELIILEETKDAVNSLKKMGFKLIVVTNQPDVGRGTQEKRYVEEINSEITRQLPVDDIIVCYHDDKDNCDCRKPLPGLLLDGAKRFNVCLSKSYIIGDRWKDIDAGFAAGCKTVHLNRGYNERASNSRPNFIVQSMKQAKDVIIGDIDGSH